MKFCFSRHLTLSVFFLLLLAVPAYWLVREKQTGRSSIPEDRKLADFPVLDTKAFAKAFRLAGAGRVKEAGATFYEQFDKRSFQRKFESAASDQFPLRFPGIAMVKAVERAQVALAYAPLRDPAIPTDMVSGLYIMRDGSQIFSNPVKYDEETIDLMDGKIAFYKKTISRNPGVNFYAFYIERIEYSAYHPLNAYFPNADGGRNFEYFKANLPAGLTLTSLNFKDFEDYKRNNYRSDHHWNIRGALAGYDIVYEMLAKGYPGISPKLEHDRIITYGDILFAGSFAGRTLNPVEADVFEVADVDLPPYRVFIDGKEVTMDSKEKYAAGKYPRAKYAHHYNYFGTGRPGTVYEYVFENGSDRDLLIVGNSYKWPIYAMLASHYHRTYTVNLLEHENFQLNKFLKEHPVQDVLFFGDPDAVFLPIN